MRAGSLASKLLALSLLAALVGAALGGVALPIWRAWEAAGEAVEDVSLRIDRLNAIAARREIAAARLEEVRSAITSARVFLPGSEEGIAAADVREALVDLTERFQTDLRTVRVLPVETLAGGQRRVAMDVGLLGPFDGVLRTLHAIETSRPYVFIREAELSIVASRQARRSAGEAAPMVNATLLLHAYLPPPRDGS